MKWNNLKTVLRVALYLIIIGAVLLVAHLQDLGDQYRVIDYFAFSLLSARPNRPYRPKPIGTKVGDKVIVMAKMEHEDTSWVAEELPEYVVSELIHVVTLATDFP